MKIEIKSAEQWSTFEKARQDCVVTSSLYAYQTGMRWASPDWAVMVWEGEEMVSNVHIITRTAKAGEEAVRLGGIGNVATKVEWRKRGYSKAAVQVAMDFLRDPLGVDFGLMITTENMVPSYTKLGWKVVAQTMRVQQPDGAIFLHYPVLVLPVCSQEWPAGVIDLCGLPW
jgi:predicted acetyltransferase